MNDSMLPHDAVGKNHTPEVKDNNSMSIWKLEGKVEDSLKRQLFPEFTMHKFWLRDFEHPKK